jgi:glycine cleavage system aminomethyltransferase T
VGPGAAPRIPEGEDNPVAFTETTDSHGWLAIIGAAASAVMERVTSLDLFAPGRLPPFLTQGPVLQTPCQIVTAGRDGVLIAVARGYGQTFADALLHAGRECGLAPAGEERFTHWVARLSTEP